MILAAGPSPWLLARVSGLLAAVTATTLVGGHPAAATSAPAPAVGFTFSASAASYVGQDPVAALDTLLERLQPDVVRLPVYWSDVAPTRHSFNFTIPDSQIAQVVAHNRHASRTAHVVLVVGVRNIGYPELWPPTWALAEATHGVPGLAGTADFRRYVTAAVRHYARNPLLMAWQVENEPLDNVDSAYTGRADLSPRTLAAEADLVRTKDPHHPLIVTSYNSSTVDLDQVAIGPFIDLYRGLPLPQPVGHPYSSLQQADVLGLDVYVVTNNTSLDDNSADRRITWKRDILGFWSKLAAAQGKAMWVTEMQSAPWNGMGGFSIEALLESATAYRDQGAGVVLLYGVEYWLQDPLWLSAGERAVRIMRGQERPIPLP